VSTPRRPRIAKTTDSGRKSTDFCPRAALPLAAALLGLIDRARA
jgi:hypothetical protein